MTGATGILRSRWLALLAVVIVFGATWRALRVQPVDRGLQVELELRTTYEDTYELYYDDGRTMYDPDHVVRVEVIPDGRTQHVLFQLPKTEAPIQGLRLDPGRAAVHLELDAITLRGPYQQHRMEPNEIAERFDPVHDLKHLQVDTAHHCVRIVCTGIDPYMASATSISTLTTAVMDPVRPVMLPFAASLVIALLCFVLLRGIQKMKVHRSGSTASAGPGHVPFRRSLWAGFFSALVFLLAWGLANNINFTDRALYVELRMIVPHADNFQVFYAGKTGKFSEGYYINTSLDGSPRPQLLRFRMPSDTLFKFLRIDLGTAQDTMYWRSMSLRCNDEVLRYDARELFAQFRPNEQIGDLDLQDSLLHITVTGSDAFLFSDHDIGPEARRLWETSGNGPIPALFGLVCALIAFCALALDRRLDGLGVLAQRPALALAITFGTLIFLPLLSEWLPVEPAVADTEKRPLADRPELTMHSLIQYPARYTKYFNDHFPFRKLLFRWNAFFHDRVLRTSSMPDNVVYGKNGWLFLMRPGVVDYYRNLPLFSEKELAEIARRLDGRKAWLKERGIDYYLCVPPLKSTMYPEYMPDKFAPVGERSGLDQLKEYLARNSTVRIIDMREDLHAARKVRDTYYTTDIHWNPWGGLIAYRTLMNAMLRDHPELGGACLPEDYVTELDTNDQGDLAMQLAMNDVYTRVTPMMIPLQPFRAQDLPEEQLPGSGFFKYRSVFIEGPDTQAPRLLMFRDSFAVYLIPYLSEHFSRSVYVWSPVFIAEIVEREDPDIVVQEVMELFLSDLLQDKLREDI